MSQYPALLVTVPLISACLVSVAGWLNQRLCFPLAAAALVAALLSSLGLLAEVLSQGQVLYRLGGWDPPWGIAYQIDHLNGLVLVVVAAVALVNLVASRDFIERDLSRRAGPFYALYLLCVTGLLGMVVTGDAFNLYVLLEIASLSGYALIALGQRRAALASLNYVFLGTIGASFYLLGVGFLYILTGSLNMADIAASLPALYGSKAVLVGFIIIIVGVWLKAAFFPLHVWLPNAYTFAPWPVSSLLAPLMTKVMIYVMLRLILTVFTPAFAYASATLKLSVVWLSVLAIVAGAVLALAQRDMKRMLTYVIVSEVGYMVGGAWLGTRLGLAAAVLHLVNDALMTLCLFLAAGAIAYKLKSSALENLKGLFSRMPFTMGALVVGALSIIGVPPTCGFFSKWYLILAALQTGRFEFVAALLFSSLINIVLFFRIFEKSFFEPFGGRDRHETRPVKLDEAPLSMLIPLLVVSAGLIVVGLYTGDIVSRVIEAAVSF